MAMPHLACTLRISQSLMTALLVLLPAMAQGQTLSLMELVQSAKQYDSTYQATLARAQADQEVEQQARASLLPSLFFSAQIDQQDNTFEAFGNRIEATRDPGTYRLVLTQALFRPQAWQTYKQGQLLAEVARLQARQAEQELLLKVTRAYFDVLNAQNDLNNLHIQKLAVKEQLDFAKKNFETGSATITDQQEAQARFDLITAQELVGQNLLSTRQLALQTITGKTASTLQTLKPDVTLEAPQPAQAQSWADQAQQSNIQVLQARLNREIAERETRKAHLGHLPTLDLTIQRVETEQQSFNGTTGQPFEIGIENNAVGLTLNMPLFSGGATQSNVRQQAHLLSSARQDFEAAMRLAQQQAKAAFLNSQSALAQVNALQTAVKSSELALASNKTGYEVGVRINIDVLNAQQQLSATQRDLSRAQYNALVQSIELQAATGQLSINHIEAIDALLVQPLAQSFNRP
jgi:outer membrane protein